MVLKLYDHGRVAAHLLLLSMLLLSVGVFAQNAPTAAPTAAPTPAAAGTATKPTALPMPALGGLAQSNPFDPARKLWPDRVAPPPPPPVPEQVTEEDLSVYGVVVAGGVQKALLKLGKRFSAVPVGANGMASVSVGAQLGEFVLVQVEPDRILLTAPGGQQWIGFGRKTDRQAGAPALRLAQPSAGQLTQTGFPPAQADAGVVVGGQAAPAPAVLGAQPAAATNAPADAPAQPAMGSLGAALSAALANRAAQQPPLNVPPLAPGINPFEALLQQQKTGR